MPAQVEGMVRTGMPTSTKLAIKAGAAALLGCFKRSASQFGNAAGSGNQFR